METAAVRQIPGGATVFLRGIVTALAAMAGLAIVVMILVTCVDVVGRWFGRPLTGTYDLVELLGAIAIAGALPYTTACRGHVAIEFFFQKLPRRARRVVDVLVHLAVTSMFVLLTWRFIQYGIDLKTSGQVTLTLRWPVFWMAWWMALCSGVTVLVILYHLAWPEKELMKP